MLAGRGLFGITPTPEQPPQFYAVCHEYPQKPVEGVSEVTVSVPMKGAVQTPAPPSLSGGGGGSCVGRFLTYALRAASRLLVGMVPGSMLASMKSNNYLMNSLCAMEAADRGGARPTSSSTRASRSCKEEPTHACTAAWLTEVCAQKYKLTVCEPRVRRRRSFWASSSTARRAISPRRP